MLTLARVLAHNADWEPAIELLEQRQIRAPDDTYALGDLAAAYAATGQAQKKLAVLESLARLRPDDAAVLNNLAWAPRGSDAEQAASLARRAHEIAPNHSMSPTPWRRYSPGSDFPMRSTLPAR